MKSSEKNKTEFAWNAHNNKKNSPINVNLRTVHTPKENHIFIFWLNMRCMHYKNTSLCSQIVIFIYYLIPFTVRAYECVSIQRIHTYWFHSKEKKNQLNTWYINNIRLIGYYIIHNTFDTFAHNFPNIFLM